MEVLQHPPPCLQGIQEQGWEKWFPLPEVFPCGSWTMKVFT